MIKTDAKVVLVDGTEHKLPLSVEVATSLVTISLTITGTNTKGLGLSAYQNNIVKTSLHVTKDQLQSAGFDIPTDKESHASIEDNLVDFLSELGVKFED